ncbi:Crp/Fnr family transcriptional regulator [Jatrophihabitans sp. DSM 45814]
MASPVLHLLWSDERTSAQTEPREDLDYRHDAERSAEIQPLPQLRRCELFASLDDDELGQLATELSFIDVVEGETVFEQAEQAEYLYVVISGRVKLRRRTADGRLGLAAIAGPGDCFGELSFLDAGPRTADAIATTSSRLARVSHDVFADWSARSPGLVLQSLNFIARRVKRAYDEREDLLFADIRTRVSKQILALSDRFGSVDAENRVVLQHGLTQQELAQLVGSSRETLSKVLAEFVRRGWILVEGRAIVIINRPRLERRARCRRPPR